MSDDELKRAASSLLLQLLACLTSSDNGRLVGITQDGADAIADALRRVRDAERQRCEERIAAQAALLERAEAALELCVMPLVATNSSALESVDAVRDAIRAAREGQR